MSREVLNIGNEGKTDAQGKKGTLRWSDANTCFEGHNGTSWKCTGYRQNYSAGPLVHLEGGTEIPYSNGAGWADNDINDSSERNIIKLNVKSGSNPAIYNDGTCTIPEDGLYDIDYKVTLFVRNPEGSFDGYGGLFYARISRNNQFFGARNVLSVLRGVKNGEYAIHDNNIVYLKKTIKLMFALRLTMPRV